MATTITKRSELVTAVTDWLDRTDLTDRVDTFIQLGESHLNRFLRTTNQIKRGTADTDQQFTELPSDWLEAYNMQINSGGNISPLKYMAPWELDQLRSNYFGATPLYYSIVGRTIELLPTPSASVTVEMAYYAKLTPLVAPDDTNWLLDSHPGAYLYATLVNSAPFLRDPERLQEWNALLTGELDELQRADRRASTSGAPLRTSGGISTRVGRYGSLRR